MNEPSPYDSFSEISSPEGASVASPTHVSNGISPAVIFSFSGAKPWIQLLAAMGYLASAFAILLTLVMYSSMTQIRNGQDPAQGLSNPASLSLILYLPMCGGAMLAAICGIIFSTKLVFFASAINRLKYSATTICLEDVMDRNRKCWKFGGIMTILAFITFLAVTLTSLWSQIALQKSRNSSPTPEQVEHAR